ncbi:MAG: amino acid permease [Acidimicrobiia bacterium]
MAPVGSATTPPTPHDAAPSTGTPRPVPAPPPSLLPPDSALYRLKRRLLGKPLHSEELEHQRLSKPVALAVFASDNLSSSAYATEEILHVLVPAVGLAAFSLVVPITAAMLVVLLLLIVSYRETIKEYPSAGGAYLVTKDNFGLLPAQVAGAALLIGYVLTVAVSVSAGSAALISTVEGLAPLRIPFALSFIALIAYGNLRGVRESGKVFAIPTYFFVLNMALLLGYGLFRHLTGGLPVVGTHLEGMVHFGADEGGGLILGASAFVLLRAFASGGAAVTGVEAISNGVPAFEEPAWRNARSTLLVMGTGLGVMFLGLSLLASRIRVAPFEDGTPTVLAQIGEAVYGSSALGGVMSNVLNTATMLILVLAANTGFADFPRLASLQAGDSFLPRQLTKRGHRLVFSTGIAALAGAAALLVVVSGAEVTRLIPLYAIAVFTGFTLSQAGMTRHHVRRRERGWVRGVVANGVGATLSGLIVAIVVVTRFEQAWVILVLMPIFVVGLLRLNRQYQTEAAHLEVDVPAAATAPILRRHVVLVFVDRLDLAAARAIQYARTLTPDELRAVHFAIDEDAARRLAADWGRLGLQRVPLELVECPDRRLTRAAVETVAAELAGGDTEVSVLLPERKYRGLWHRILHDRTGDSIQAEVSRLPHANVTSVPFHLDALGEDRVPLSALVRGSRATEGEGRVAAPPGPVPAGTGGGDGGPVDPGATPIVRVRYRDDVEIAGHVRSVRVAPLRDAPTFEVVVADHTAAVSLVFLGRRGIPGIQVGTRLRARGTVGIHKDRLALLNPLYELIG